MREDDTLCLCSNHKIEVVYVDEQSKHETSRSTTGRVSAPKGTGCFSVTYIVEKVGSNNSTQTYDEPMIVNV